MSDIIPNQKEKNEKEILVEKLLFLLSESKRMIDAQQLFLQNKHKEADKKIWALQMQKSSCEQEILANKEKFKLSKQTSGSHDHFLFDLHKDKHEELKEQYEILTNRELDIETHIFHVLYQDNMKLAKNICQIQEELNSWTPQKTEEVSPIQETTEINNEINNEIKKEEEKNTCEIIEPKKCEQVLKASKNKKKNRK